MSSPRLSQETIKSVVHNCNSGLVPAPNYSSNEQYASEWFRDFFDFIEDEKLRTQLGDAFYQARFMYRIMSSLRLPFAKHKGIVKFQIVQYASICEALLDYTIKRYFQADAERHFSVVELKKENNSVASDVRIQKGTKPLFLCYEKLKKGDLKRTRTDFKIEYAREKGIISQDLETRACALYNLRNNVHILKASEAGYVPKLKESKEAFILMQEFSDAVKTFIINQENKLT